MSSPPRSSLLTVECTRLIMSMSRICSGRSAVAAATSASSPSSDTGSPEFGRCNGGPLILPATPATISRLAQACAEADEALYQGDDGAYINFFGPHDGERIEAAYPGETLARLRRIKATYDPMNLSATTTTSRPPERAFLSESGHNRYIQ